MRFSPPPTRLLAWAIGTLTVAFFLILGFWQLLHSIPTYTIEDIDFKMLKGGSPVGFKLAYFGTFLLVMGQLYTLRKATAGVSQARIGRRRSWLQAHCYLDVGGVTLVLIHSGFPLSFRYANPFPYLRPTWGFIGLTGVQGFATWLVLVTVISGIVGEGLRASPSRSRLLRPWLKIHVLLTCLLFVFGIIHLFIVLWLKYVSAA